MVDIISRKGIRNYSDFVSYVAGISDDIVRDKFELTNNNEEIKALINGASAEAISQFIDIPVRKNKGVFFTNKYLAEKIAKRIHNELQQEKSVCDPTCGAGDLLMACIKFMPYKKTMAETLSCFSGKIFGQDLFPDFVRLARARLVLSFVFSPFFQDDGEKYRDGKKFFENIVVGDFLKDPSIVKKADCIVTNPPYGYADLTGKVDWARGKGQKAALFLDFIIRSSEDGQRIVAILPDVLRSGSRYAKWRSFITSNSTQLSTEICGRFNDEADVDVFILDFVICKNGKIKGGQTFDHYTPNNATYSMSEIFNISVGPVVPHRDKQVGNCSPYLDTSTATLWKEVIPTEKKKYKCTLKTPPFVVLRRTSSPDENPRLKASIIKGKESVAVENHLIVMEPKDGKLRTCREFLRVAKGVEANSWINLKTRCRHLTVAVIREMPIFDFKIS